MYVHLMIHVVCRTKRPSIEAPLGSKTEVKRYAPPTGKFSERTGERYVTSASSSCCWFVHYVTVGLYCVLFQP